MPNTQVHGVVDRASIDSLLWIYVLPSRDVEVVELKHEPPAEHIPLGRDLQAALEASDRELEDRRWRNADLQRQEFGRKLGLIKG